MGLPRDLVELEAWIRERADVDLFSPIERSGLLAAPEFASLMARIVNTDPASVMRLCLQALRIQYDEMHPKLIEAELVATLPPGSPGIARPTKPVMNEMIGRAAREIILLGYEVTDRDMITLLAAAASRGVNVIIICDRSRGGAPRVLEAWPIDTARPKVFQDRDRADGDPYASMHAKCLLVDGDDLLVTSANFTFHGLRGNIEIGVRLSGAPASEARKVFSYLVEMRIVEELKTG